MFPHLGRPRTRCNPCLEALESRHLLASLPFSESPLVSTLGPADRILVVGDFDGDGRDDLVASNSLVNIDSPSSSAWYRLNTTTQRWEQAGTFPNHTADLPSWPVDWQVVPSAAVDMDGDQDLDLVIESTYWMADSYTILEWLENSDGRGTFTTYHSMNVQGLSLSYELADLDNDGDTDVGFTHASTGLDAFRAWSENRPDGFVRHEVLDSQGFGIGEDHLYDPNNDGHRSVPVFIPRLDSTLSADLDGDGDLDIITNRAGISRWSENTDGQANFKWRGEVTSSSDSRARVLPEDIDGDGDVDLWVQSEKPFAWYENRGNWSFVRHAWNLSVEGPIFRADVDGNGVDELVALNPDTHQLVWYDANPAANMLTPHVTQAPETEKAEVAVDFNRDGRTDLMGIVGWYEQMANAHEFVLHRYPASVQADQVAVHDFDGDGLLDVAFVEVTRGFFGNTEWTLSWMRRTAEGFAEPTRIGSWRSEELRWRPDSQDLQIRDFDGDGVVDLLHLSHGNLTWFQQTSPLTFERRNLSDLPNEIGSLDNLVDWDGDNDLDAVIFSGGFGLHLQTSPGTFTRSNVPVPVSTDKVAVGDLDGDGDLDLAFVTVSSNGPGIIGWIPFHNGTNRGVVRQIGTYPVDHHAATIRIADLNGDGDLDLVVQHGLDSNPVTVAANLDLRYKLFDNRDGAGTFEESQEVIDHVGPLRVMADVNGDGLVDLVNSPQAVTGIVVHYNQSPVPFPAGDINRDGAVTVADLGAFCAAFPLENPSRELDVNRDGQINQSDHAYLVEDLLQLVYGDANFDGRFDSADLVLMFAAGGYENRDLQATWAEGDFNCDGRFDSADLVKALQMGGYE